MSDELIQRDIEFHYIVSLLCGKVNEKFYMERYVAFWNFISLLCCSEDDFTREELRVCSVANVVASLIVGKLPRFIGGDDKLEALVNQEFTYEICAKIVIGLSNDDDSLSDRIKQLVDSMYEYSVISEALLRLATVQPEDPKRVSSLAKAYHFVRSGGFHRAEDGNSLEDVPKEASLKGFWKSWCDTYPFVHAFDSAGIELADWSPFLEHGSEKFSHDLSSRPDLFVNVFGTAKSIQLQMISLLDETARKRPFFKFPDDIVPTEWRAQPLDERQLEIASSYRYRS
jgi:hypothetical protein